MNIHKETSKWTSRIANVQLFSEPPSRLPSDTNYAIMGLPKDFIESADRELDLDGELISYMKVQGTHKVEQIKRRLEDSETQFFFSGRAKSSLWDIYYGSGASGVRYSILVEYHVYPGRRFDTEKSRQTVFLEWEELFLKAAMECVPREDRDTSEGLADAAIASSSHKIMTKYGISQKEMMDIISEGTAKWSMFKFKMKG